jgi:hypothetical protein
MDAQQARQLLLSVSSIAPVLSQVRHNCWDTGNLPDKYDLGSSRAVSV